jgi:hypothetical protein
VTRETPIVTLFIEAGDVFDDEDYEVVPDTRFHKVVSADLYNYPHTVSGLLQAVSDDISSAGLKFYGKSGTSLVPFTPSMDYVAAVEYDDNTWKDGVFGFDGWEFRVNGKFPVQKFATNELGPGWQGADILETPVKHGDIVHFFYEFPSNLYGGSGNIAANYARAVFKRFADDTLTVRLRGHKVYINPAGGQNIMNVYNYFNLTDLPTGITASLYEEDGTPVVTNQTVSADGTAAFESASIEAGKTYLVTTTPTYYTTTDDTWQMINGAYFSQTSAYDKVTIPAVVPTPTP